MMDLDVRIALRLALYQLKFLDRIPPHSALNESVNLVHRAKKSSARPFVNAILRRSLREKVEIEFTDELDRVSVETSHPRWLLEKWSDNFGPDSARSIAAANNTEPQIAFRILCDNGDRFELENGFRRSDLVPDCYLGDQNDKALVRMANENTIYFQDEGSQMIAHSVKANAGDRILDVCASPGGKTGIIAQNARNVGAAVFAGDITGKRVKLLAENTARQRVFLNGIVQYDASDELPFAGRAFDSVLVDAPCTGTGTIRHNPELRYLVAPDDFARLADKQLSILVSASDLVRHGGQLIYSTCSLEPEENEDVCDRFLNDVRGFTVETPAIPNSFFTSEGYGRTRPDVDQMDGFFIAVFRNDRG